MTGSIFPISRRPLRFYPQILLKSLKKLKVSIKLRGEFRVIFIFLRNNYKQSLKYLMRIYKYLFLCLTIAGLVSCDLTPDEEVVLENPLTIERLYNSPLLSGEKPRGLKISPDGKRVTLLKGRHDVV
jgi:hypothetical protein